MNYRHLAPAIMQFLNAENNRGKWHDTRAVAHGIFRCEWASQDDMDAVRQSLRNLERKGLVARVGYFAEWRSTKYPQEELPKGMSHLLAAVDEFARR